MDLTVLSTTQKLPISSYDLKMVTDKFMKDENLDQLTAQDIEREFIKFANVLAINPEKDFSVKGIVDKYWHTFILHTSDYINFCKINFQKYLHHTPSPATRIKSHVEKESNRYNDFLIEYSKLFGDPNPIYWPSPKKFEMNNGCSNSGACGCGCDSNNSSSNNDSGW